MGLGRWGRGVRQAWEEGGEGRVDGERRGGDEGGDGMVEMLKELRCGDEEAWW